MPTCVWQRYDPQYCIQNKLDSSKKQDIINNSNQKDNKSHALYEYKVGHQVFLETPKILQKLSTTLTGPYPITSLFKNGTIKIQKYKKEMYQKD
jgi:hypothetical protein